MTDLTPSSSGSLPVDRTQSNYFVEPGPSKPAIRISTFPATKPTGRAYESRKLLAHILDQLNGRPKPPLLFEAFSNAQSTSIEKNPGAFLEMMKGKRRDTKQSVQVEPMDDDTEDELDGVFTTNVTYDLMVQLKNVLMMSVAQGWHIFDGEYDQPIVVVLCH